MSQSPLQIGAALKRLRTSRPALIGRDQELATLRAFIQARRPVFVSGPSGVGKTALLHAVYGEWDADRAGFRSSTAARAASAAASPRTCW